MKLLSTILHFLLLSWPFTNYIVQAANEPASYSASDYGNTQVQVRREGQLDHWDSDTLAFHLDEYQGYDVAIMFYASWDSNSHALAPYWDAIATQLRAGSVRSKLIMAVMDCEVNTAHSTLCTAAGVTHYPTLLFIGSGPYYDGVAPIPNTVKFQGRLQHVDSILDWIRTMQGLSQWHKWTTQGWGRWMLRSWSPWSPNSGKYHATLGSPTDPNSLPVGIPTATTSRGAGSSVSGGSTDHQSMRLAALEQQNKDLTAQATTWEESIVRTSNMLDAILVPPFAPTSTTNSIPSSISKAQRRAQQDIFSLMQKRNAWDATTNKSADDPQTHFNVVLKSCLTEVTMDYCQRIMTKVTAEVVVDEWLATQEEGPLSSQDELSLEQNLSTRLRELEPFCAMVDECMMQDFATEACRPVTCPFYHETACRYTAACLDPTLQEDFAKALGLSDTLDKSFLLQLEEAQWSATLSSTSSGSTTSTKEQPRRAWGF
eukprot:Nitzschia sp. Nitz4//scaffold428_size8251//3292//4749//NITZ4_009133-RA/size8251-processed-gene-0.41-mRNA-1//-1//CDS//3329551635//7385//frame0